MSTNTYSDAYTHCISKNLKAVAEVTQQNMHNYVAQVSNLIEAGIPKNFSEALTNYVSTMQCCVKACQNYLDVSLNNLSNLAEECKKTPGANTNLTPSHFIDPNNFSLDPNNHGNGISKGFDSKARSSASAAK